MINKLTALYVPLVQGSFECFTGPAGDAAEDGEGDEKETKAEKLVFNVKLVKFDPDNKVSLILILLISGFVPELSNRLILHHLVFFLQI